MTRSFRRLFRAFRIRHWYPKFFPSSFERSSVTRFIIAVVLAEIFRISILMIVPQSYRLLVPSEPLPSFSP